MGWVGPLFFGHTGMTQHVYFPLVQNSKLLGINKKKSWHGRPIGRIGPMFLSNEHGTARSPKIYGLGRHGTTHLTSLG